MKDTSYVPPVIGQLADEVEDATGVRPTMVVERPGTWKLRLDGEHVVATGGYRIRSMDGRLVPIKGTLTVNGESRRTVRSNKELGMLWRRYELGVIESPPPLPAPWPDLQEAPEVIRKSYEQTLKGMKGLPGAEDVPASVVYDAEADEWWVCLEFEEHNSCVRTRFTRRAKGWFPDSTGPVVYLDGMRTSGLSHAEIVDMLHSILNLKNARPASRSEGSIQGGRTDTPSTSNAVTTRRATVIRV